MNYLLVNYLKQALDFPKELHLESSSQCNAFCLTCPRDKMQRSVGELSRELFIKAVTETSTHEMDYIMLHLNGEPLYLGIDELVWRINCARDLNPRTKQINFFTNGSLLDDDKIDKILTSKLDLIMISIDGGTKEDYEKIRRGLSWDILLKNVQRLVKRKRELNSKCIIQTAIIPQKDNASSVQRYFTLFTGIGVDNVGGSGVNNIGGLIDSKDMRLAEQHVDTAMLNHPCFKIFLDLSIMSDGRACVCAQDVIGALPIGDLKTQSLKEIWQGTILTKIRENFIYDRKFLVPFCKECDYMEGFVPPDYWKVSLTEWQECYEKAKNS